VAASPLRIENGLAVISTEPGSGTEFNDAAVEKYLA
jgi:L-alanine-DL-glutamate epimerase-like enolase superfamily enzyme